MIIRLLLIFCFISFSVANAGDHVPKEQSELCNLSIKAPWYNDFTGQTHDIITKLESIYIQRSPPIKNMFDALGNGTGTESLIPLPDTICHSTVIKLLTKPSDEIKQLNPSGYLSQLLLETAYYLQIPAAVAADKPGSLKQFASSLAFAIVKKPFIKELCEKAHTDISQTQRIPSEHDDQHPLAHLITLMNWAQGADNAENRQMINDVAYETGLMHDLYTIMYTQLMPQMQPTTNDWANDYAIEISQTYLKALQERLFALPAWHAYVEMHNIRALDDCKQTNLLYGKIYDHIDSSSFATHHLHIAFHDNIDTSVTGGHRSEQMPLEMTTIYSDLYTKLHVQSIQRLDQTKSPYSQKIYFLNVDAEILTKILSAKRIIRDIPYDLANIYSEVEITAGVLKKLSPLSSFIHINLGNLSADKQEALKKEATSHNYIIEKRPCSFNRSEFWHYHREKKAGSQLPGHCMVGETHKDATVIQLFEQTLQNKTKLFFMGAVGSPPLKITGPTITFYSFDPEKKCYCN